ncbi:MAG: zinc ribbon domain-containing protein [Rhodocyclaceae bacterium]|nr:zinc ribbon domain-containing protein [Rhodocyclaceae bacterium]
MAYQRNHSYQLLKWRKHCDQRSQCINMTLGIFDFLCADCGNSFEAMVVRSDSGSVHCPRCMSSSVGRLPVLQMSVRTSKTRHGSLIDMSSNSCPCGCASGKHAHKRA